MENLDDPAQKWPLKKRLEFIDFRLFWNGKVNRGDIGKAFNITVQQASSDIGHTSGSLLAICSMIAAKKPMSGRSNIANTHRTRYRNASCFSWLGIDRGRMIKEETWFNELPPMDVTTLKRRPTNSLILLHVLNAIRDGALIRIAYNSLHETADSARIIAPHALFFNSGRWYTRGLFRRSPELLGHNLNRIDTVVNVEGTPPSKEPDYEWAHTIDLEISPNPELPPTSREG
ncbi:MAG: WYL domain-containing protein [Rhizobium sp.]|nr:WYL domain-containing protein [Rhizobium sp.]